MLLSDLGKASQSTLEARGLRFAHYRSVALSVLLPAGWVATWREDYLLATHGQPPVGFLTVYPVPLNQPLRAAEVLDAFIGEYLEPTIGQVHMQRFAAHPTVEGLELATFDFFYQGEETQAMALASVQEGQAKVVAYTVPLPMFQEELVQHLLATVLSSLEIGTSSRKGGALPLERTGLWPSTDLEPSTPCGSANGRFALKLLPDWELLEVSYEGEKGWLLSPPGHRLEAGGGLLISLSGADLLHPLELQIREALLALSEEYQPEGEPLHEISVDQELLVQRWLRPASSTSPEAWLWSVGVSDGTTVVHLLAMGAADRLSPHIPALAAMGRTLRALPRVPNADVMKQLCGIWRQLDADEAQETVLEVWTRLLPDGSFSRLSREVPQKAALEALIPSDLEQKTDGRWDVVGDTLTFFFEDGRRESLEVEGVTERTAVVGRSFWERYPQRGASSTLG